MCPHCGAVGTLQWLDSVLKGRSLSLTTLRGTIDDLRVRNAYCVEE